MSLFQPVTQVRLTNVAVVRYKKHGCRFEIACYRNKVMNWRNKVETDIDEVLQTQSVFQNVSKGVLAKKKDCEKVFGVTDDYTICLMILEKGQLQISDKERKHEQDSKLRDIITIVTDKCINSETRRPFPMSMIESALKEAHFSVKPKHSAKKQALEVIKVLKDYLPIQRAQMRIRISCPRKSGKQLKKAVQPLLAEIEEEDWSGGYEMICLIDPGAYRSIDEQVKKITRGAGSFDILDLQQQSATGTVGIDDDLNGSFGSFGFGDMDGMDGASGSGGKGKGADGKDNGGDGASTKTEASTYTDTTATTSSLFANYNNDDDNGFGMFGSGSMII